MSDNKNKGPMGGGPHRGMGAPVKKPKNARKTIARLFSYIRGDIGGIIFVLCCLLVSAAGNLAGSYMLRPMINTYIVPTDGSAGDVQGLAKALILMLAVFMISVVASYFQYITMLKISQKALRNIRKELFDKLQKLPIRYYDQNTNGEIMSRFTNDVDNIGELMNSTIVSLFSGIISIIGTLSMMFYTSWQLTLVSLATLPLTVFAVSLIAKASRKYYSAQQAALGDVNGYIEETVSGQKVVKVFNHEAKACEEFSEKNIHLRNQQYKAQFAGSIMGPVAGNISQLAYALTATIGGVLCIAGKFDLGGLSVFVNFSRQFSRPINEVSMQINTVFSALAGAERVFAVMDEDSEYLGEEDIPDLTDVKGDVSIEHVSFSYIPEKQVLKDVSFYAHPGQKIALVGSTGAGKTTITNLLTRFYDISEGKITIDGVDIRSVSKDSLRRNIAMVLQDTHLFTGTVRENIRYGRPDATDEDVVEAAKTASAHSFIARLPQGYDTMLEGDGANLSQGQRQLINIARAAISKAPILILDEATSSVDTRTEKHIEKGMDRLMADRTTFVIAHRLSTVRNANAIMVLEHGEIIERGDHDDLLAQKGRYYQLYNGMAELS